MRIVSLVPAATAWLVAFGAGEQVVDLAAEEATPEAIRRLGPDLVVAPDPEALAGLGDVAAVAFDPQSLKQVLEAALRLGRAAGYLPEAMRVIGEGEQRLRALHERIGRRRDGTLAGRPAPTAAVLERLDPPTLAGRWVPDLIEQAGGRPVGIEDDPDVLVVAAPEQPDRSAWARLGAMRAGRVFACDGEAYFRQPGPSLYRATELLAAALHGARAGVVAEPWELRLIAPASGTAGPGEV